MVSGREGFSPISHLHFPLDSLIFPPCVACDTHEFVSAMANQHYSSSSSRPWFFDAVTFLVLALIAAHVLALLYSLYRLATEKQPTRKKIH
ncbi:Transmembrane protein [Senna tora]|uniref:Transmembrane protein n=1 Tax=Senna tora TaxID=362788 RepID=A0A834U1A0_9FABA|nr:Transmembrane protein [Senna tora]